MVTQALLQPPNEEGARHLWGILDSKGLSGSKLSQKVDVPISAENIGARMLIAMGWQEGTGLGSSGHGIQEPISAYKCQPRNKAGIGWKKMCTNKP